MHNSVKEASNGMKVGDVVTHIPWGYNWHFSKTSKNPRSGNRKVRIVELYNFGECAVITPVSGLGAGYNFLCNLTDLKPIQVKGESEMKLFVYDETTFGLIIDDNEIGTIQQRMDDTWIFIGDDGTDIKAETMADVLVEVRDQYNTCFG